MRAIDAAPLPTGLPRRPAGRRWWLPGLVLSILLHLLLLAAAGGMAGLPTTMAQAPVVTIAMAAVALRPPAPAAASATASAPDADAAGAPARPVAVARPRPRQPRRSVGASAMPMSAASTAPSEAEAQDTTVPQPGDATPAETSAGEASATAQAEAAADAAVAGPRGPVVPPLAAGSGAAAAPAPTSAASQNAKTGAAAPAAPRYNVNLPPSATLSYEVRYATRGSITRGSSTVDWRSNGDGYAIRGEVSKFGFTLSAFRSEGAIDDAGIAPVLYAEKNARRAETNTHFLRDARQAISFSAATDSFPLEPGAQDRASILWQLAGIARGQPELLVPGTMLDVVVAGVRDAEHWMIAVIGEETVGLDTGEANETRAWHLVRAPRSGTYDKRIDVWLAPAQQWYPVKLRYTEQSGDYLDLSLSALR